MKEIFAKIDKGYPRASEITRFLLVGGLATAVDMLVMAIVMFLPNHSLYGNNIVTFFLNSGITPTKWVVVGTVVGFLVGLVINYVLSYKFVYRGENKKAKTKKGFVLFLVLSAIGLLIQTAGMFVGYDILKLNEWLLKVVLVLIVLAFNYVTRKMFVFNDNKPVVAVPVSFDDYEKKTIERVVFLLLFLVYFVVAYTFLYFLVWPKQSYIFNADHFRVFADWNTFAENHYRTKVHPLYVLFIYPIFSILKFLGAEAYFACVLFCATVSTVNTILVYKIIGKLTGRPHSLVTILTSLLFAFSFAVLDNTLKMESYAIGCLTLLAFWYWFVCNYQKELGWKDYLILVGLGVLTFSITLTNYAQFCIGLLFLFVFKKFKSAKEFFKSLAIMFAIIISSLLVSWAFILLQSAIFKSSEDAIMYSIQIFLDLIKGTSGSEEFMYMGENSIAKSLKIEFLYYFGYAFAGGEISTPGNYLHLESTIFTKLVSFGLFAFFIYGTFKIIKEKRYIYLPLVISFVFEYILHSIYGTNTIILYLLHGIFVIPIVSSVAICGDSKYDKYLRYVFIGLLVICLLQSVLGVFSIFFFIFRDYGLTLWNPLIGNLRLIIFVPLVIALVCLSSAFFNYYKAADKPIEVKPSKPNLWKGAVALIMVGMLLVCSILNIVEAKRQLEIENAPPTLILMGIGQRKKHYLQKEDEEYVLYSYDVATKTSVIVLENISDITFNVEDNYVIECVDENENVFHIRETEDSLHYEIDGQVSVLDDRDVSIPDFEGMAYQKYMKFLFYETMVNCIEGGFCFNYLTSPEIISDIDGKMGMVLEKTNNKAELSYNVDLDNVKSYGQSLYLLGFNAGANESLINTLITMAEQETEDGLLNGSVYETIWLRYALDRLGKEADWCIVPDEYSAEKDLCWFYKPQEAEMYNDNITNVQERLFNFYRNWYPYMDITKLHYFGKIVQIPDKLKYPISFEYNPELPSTFKNKLSLCSRTAAELLLYLMEYDTYSV